MRTFTLALAAIVCVSFVFDKSWAADRLPAFDVAHNCKEEGAGTGIGSPASCMKDENDAKDQLAKEWSRFSASQKRACVGESTVGGDQSYVELLTCLEMSAGGQFRPKD